MILENSKWFDVCMNLKLKYDVWFYSIFVNKTSYKKIFERISIYSIMYRIWPTLNFIIWRKTAHSQFSILFNLNETPVLSLKGKEKKRDSSTSDVYKLRWSMVPKSASEVVDQLFRKIMKIDLPFNGTCILLRFRWIFSLN
jgi:hypothetical protein